MNLNLNGISSGISAFSEQPAAIKQFLATQFAADKYFENASAQAWQQATSKMSDLSMPTHAASDPQKNLAQLLDPSLIQLLAGWSRKSYPRPPTKRVLSRFSPSSSRG